MHNCKSGRRQLQTIPNPIMTVTALLFVFALYSTVQKKCKRNLPKWAKLREFRQSNFELSFQTKMGRNFDASIALMSAKFRKQCDESKRNFAA